MSVKKRRYTAAFKTKLVLQVLAENKTLNEIASAYNLSPKNLQSWKKQFLENAALAMEPSKAVKEYKDQIKEKDLTIESLHKSLGKAVLEKDWLSKKLMSLESKEKKLLINPQAQISIQNQCKLIGLNRSSYYYKYPKISSKKLELQSKVDEIYTELPFYGSRKIHQQLLENGEKISVNTVARYMSEMNLKAIFPGKRITTTESKPEHKKYPYVLRGKSITNANQVWSTDITYIRMKHGFVYLAAVIDWYSKAVLSHRISNSMDTGLVTDVLEEALSLYPRPEIMNTDQGSQYTSSEHIQLLNDHSIKISMDGKGRATDNIAIERFWRSAKYENIYLNQYDSLSSLKKGLKEYIDFYNNRRFHQSLEYQKPMDVYLNSGKTNEALVA